MKEINNPLYLAVLTILKKTNASISLFDLMKLLEAQGFTLSGLSKDEDVSHEILIFRKNFIVMNALYAIQSDLIKAGYSLYISSLKILIYSNSHLNTELTDDLLIDAQKKDVALGKYYLDWSNFDQADQQYVDGLLNSFWKKYKDNNKNSFNQDKRSYALQILGVESTASWKDIQQAYRQKITQCHPDKGGTSHQFIEVREAFQFLKLFQ